MAKGDPELFALIRVRVRERRLALGLTQRQVAERMGVHGMTVSLIELGHRGVGLGTLVGLARALECSAVDLCPPLGEDQPLSNF